VCVCVLISLKSGVKSKRLVATRYLHGFCMKVVCESVGSFDA